MPVTPARDDHKITRRAILRLLLGGYPAQYSDGDVIAQISRDPDDPGQAIDINDALRQLQADRLIRRHGRYWAASRVAVQAHVLLDE